MVHFLDRLPLDWTLPETRELRDFLAASYFRDQPVVQFAQQAGVDPAAILWSQPMRSVWHDLLSQARGQNRLRELLAQIAARDEAVGDRLQELLDHAVVEAPAEARSGDWWAAAGTDVAERQIFDEPTLLDVAFMERGVELAGAVVRLLVQVPGGTKPWHGTAFHIGDGYLVTNHHVLFDKTVPATRVEARLGFELDSRGRVKQYQELECEPTTIIGDAHHDWAAIRLGTPSPDLPVVDPTAGGTVDVADRVYIIQHPLGGVKKIGMHHNTVRHIDADRVQYWTDTEPGSSGSPVFNAHWQVVAVHRRAVTATAANGTDREYRNEGCRMERVAEGLASAGLL